MAPRHSFRSHIVSFLLCIAPAHVLAQNQTANLVHACLQQEGLQASISSDSTWANDTASFQFRIKPEPVAIAFPQDKEEVALALSCARNNSVKVSTVGRAHSFQGYGFGNAGNLVIDLAAFTDLSFDEATNELTYGGGANVGPTAKFLWDNHRRHFPHVRGSHVGLTGSTFGGGYGTTSRFLGTPVDHLVSVEYVLYNGSVVTAGPGSDLLWAAQGAGPSFGVAVSSTIKTHEIPHDSAVNYTLSLGSKSVDVAAQALLLIQDFVLEGSAPDEFSLRFSLSNFQSAGFFYGDPATFDETFAPLVESLRAVAPSVNLTKTELPTFWDSEVASTGVGMNSPTGGSLGGRASLVQSWVTTNDRPFTLDQATALFQSYHSLNRTDISGSGFLDLWGGISRDIKDTDTSFAHGNNLWLVRFDGVASGAWPADGVAYLHDLIKPFEDSIKESGPLRGFVNYVDSELSVDEWGSRLYGDNFAKLQSIKAAVDPTGLFSGYGLAIPIPSSSRR